MVDMLLAHEEINGATAENFWTLGDHQNSVRDYISHDGQTVENRVAYNAFGQRLSETNPAAVDVLFGFTGKPSDKSTGLQNNVNRWYDPVLHQWLSEDPLGLGPDENPRRYVGNDPVNFVDPEGLDYVRIIGGIAQYVSESSTWWHRRINRGSLATSFGDEVSPGLIKVKEEFGGGVVALKDLDDIAFGNYSSNYADRRWNEDHRLVYKLISGANRLEEMPTTGELAEHVVKSTFTLRYLDNAKREADAATSKNQQALMFFNPASRNFGLYLFGVSLAGGVFEVGPTSMTSSYWVMRDGLAEEMERNDNVGADAILGTVCGVSYFTETIGELGNFYAQGGVGSLAPGAKALASSKLVQAGTLTAGGGLTAYDISENGLNPQNGAAVILLGQGIFQTRAFSESRALSPQRFWRDQRGSLKWRQLLLDDISRLSVREQYARMGITTSSNSEDASRTYTIYESNGEPFKFGVTDANLVRYNESLKMAGPGSYGVFTEVVPKYQAHLQEKYLRSVHYSSTGQWSLPGMKVPYPVDFSTGKPIQNPTP